MKKLLILFLIIAGTITAQAQDTKPTKEQTIEFITNSLVGKTAHYDRQGESAIVVKEIVVKDCEFRVRSLSYGDIKILNFKLSDIENLFIYDFKNMDGKVVGKVLRFEAFNKKDLITETELGKDNVSTTSHKDFADVIIPDTPKIVDAFNHLRKLCGAPEPIKF